MAACPPHSLVYNNTLCACDPGRYLANGSCLEFTPSPWASRSGASSEPTFLTTVLPPQEVHRLTEGLALLLEVTLVTLVAWLLFCLALRFTKLDGGDTVWFRLRWWISRLDFLFSTRHWVNDGEVVTKRRTELGGSLSVANWILFAGLFSASLYKLITKRSIEVHRVRPADAQYLAQFVNDMEFNITTVSSMSCSHLRGLDTLITGSPRFIDYRAFPLSMYVTYNCYNTSIGPTISLRCSSCQIPRRNHYISWQFVDLPNDPAMAVGFQFNLTAKDHDNNGHVSFVAGTLTSDSYSADKPKSFRGPEMNVLKIHLFPQAYNNLHNLKLIQPLFHDFIPGSYLSEASALQASLQSSKDGLINTTLFISYLSDYIVEIDRESLLGPVAFLAEVGGLYALSLAIFMYLFMQCEFRIKKLRYEDAVMRELRSRRRAQKNWDKLRKFVMYTWGPSNLDEDKASSHRRHGALMVDSFLGLGSIQKKRKPNRRDIISVDKNAIQESTSCNRIRSASTGHENCGSQVHFEIEDVAAQR